MKPNIPNLPYIHVTRKGEVYRLDVYTKRNGEIYQKRNGKPKLLPIYIKYKTENYPIAKVSISIPGYTRSLKVSRLVALTYIPKPENKPCVCHKDNNPLNNDVDNLYWGTVQENISQKVRDGRAKKGSKFSNRLKNRVCRYKSRHPSKSIRELSTLFNISPSSIYIEYLNLIFKVIISIL